MKNKKKIEKVENLLSRAEVKINGSSPCDIQIKDDRFFGRFLRDGSLALGESFVDGWWECERLDELFTRLIRADVYSKLNINRKTLFYILKTKFFNIGKKSEAFVIGEKHYDLGNNLFLNFLDKRMVYSCGYWKDAVDLDQAQENKLDLICKKIGLRTGMKVLDIGCGWGGFAKFAAEKYGVKVVGVTVSKDQVDFGKKLCSGLPVEMRLQDYRDLGEKFDRIVSIGMFEHVCEPNYREYMRVAHRCLEDDGLFLLHTIGGNEPIGFRNDYWIAKYIFPNSELPCIKQIGKAIEGLFVMEDWQNFGTDYDKTLAAWNERFSKNWEKIKSDYDEKFFRLWKYFLMSSQGHFRSRFTQLWQIILSKGGIPGGYQKNISYGNFQEDQ